MDRIEVCESCPRYSFSHGMYHQCSLVTNNGIPCLAKFAALLRSPNGVCPNPDDMIRKAWADSDIPSALEVTGAPRHGENLAEPMPHSPVNVKHGVAAPHKVHT